MYAIAAGSPNYTSSGTSKFIPEIWAAALLENFYPSTCFTDISNTEYSGQITQQGSKVIIRTIPETTVRAYVRGQDLVYDSYESPTVEMEIDKSNYFGHRANALDKKQADVDYISSWARDAAQRMTIATDVDMLNNIYTGAHASNKGATAGKRTLSYDLGAATAPFAATKGNIVDKIVDLGSVLSENDVPREGRWVVFPTHFMNLIKKSEIKDASLTGDSSSVIRNGRVGMIDTFTLYESNNYTGVADTYLGAAVTAFHILFGIAKATGFATQMDSVETLKNPREPGDLIRGWNLYGYKVIKSQGLGDFYAFKA